MPHACSARLRLCLQHAPYRQSGHPQHNHGSRGGAQHSLAPCLGQAGRARPDATDGAGRDDESRCPAVASEYSRVGRKKWVISEIHFITIVTKYSRVAAEDHALAAPGSSAEPPQARSKNNYPGRNLGDWAVQRRIHWPAHPNWHPFIIIRVLRTSWLHADRPRMC